MLLPETYTKPLFSPGTATHEAEMLWRCAPGQRLYLAARAGETVERQRRAIHVSQFDLWRDAPGAQDVHFRIACSKGTYIRALAHDLVRLTALLATSAADDSHYITLPLPDSFTVCFLPEMAAYCRQRCGITGRRNCT